MTARIAVRADSSRDDFIRRFVDFASPQSTKEREPWDLGGPRTIQAFREVGGIDRFELYVLPVLLGSGIPLFAPGAAPLTLRLDRQRVFPDGAVELIYSLEENENRNAAR